MKVFEHLTWALEQVRGKAMQRRSGRKGTVVSALWLLPPAFLKVHQLPQEGGVPETLGISGICTGASCSLVLAIGSKTSDTTGHDTCCSTAASNKPRVTGNALFSSGIF